MANQLDKFGIKMIYATRVGAREWFIRESVSDIDGDSKVDGDFDDLADSGNNTDGFTVKDNGQVRLKVCPESSMRGYRNTGLDQGAAKGRGYMSSSKEWDTRGIEQTARIKVTNATSDDEADFIMKGPTGSHTSNTTDCSGSAYSNNFYIASSGNWSGKTEMKKEQYHVHYKNRGNLKSTGLGSIFNKWVVCKNILYQQKSSDGTKTNMKVELWLNINNDGITFKKVNETLDTGGWGDDATRCGADRKDEIMTWRAPFMMWRWDGPSIKFKDLSVREIDPSKLASDVGGGEPQETPTTGTISRDFTFRQNIIAFPIDACSLGQAASTFKEIYNVSSDGSASNLHRDRYRVCVLCNGDNSELIGKKPKKIILRLSRTGSLPSGNVTCVLRDGGDDEVNVTFNWTGGTLAASAVATSITDYTFENLTSNYVMKTGDRICVEFSGNTTDTTNEINVFRNTDDPFDGANTCAIKFDTSGTPPPTAYSSPDVFRDYAWIIYEAAGDTT